jgi:hypothetical protein
VLHPQPSSPSAFFSSSSLQQAPALLVGVPPQHPADALVLILSTLVIVFFSKVAIVSISILSQIKLNNLFSI